jgi:hypothetical protein
MVGHLRDGPDDRCVARAEPVMPTPCSPPALCIVACRAVMVAGMVALLPASGCRRARGHRQHCNSGGVKRWPHYRRAVW